MNNNKVEVRFPLVEILTIIFVVAKLVGTITWSWYWVLSPLWLPWALIGGILLLAGTIVVGMALIGIVINAFEKW